MVALYQAGGRTIAVVDDPYGPARLVDLDSGELHGLYPAGGGFRSRHRLGDARRRERERSRWTRPART